MPRFETQDVVRSLRRRTSFFLNAHVTLESTYVCTRPIHPAAGGRLFEEDADLAVFLVAAIQQLVQGNFLQPADGVDRSS